MTRHRGLLLFAIGLYVALYVVEKLQSGEGFDPLAVAVDVVEMALLAGAVYMTTIISLESRAIQSERKELQRDLAHARSEGEHWRRAARGHVEGLSQAIEAQFSEWGLTASEADVAGLMLKGLAHKEIAGLRGNTEATVRQHAAMVYRKSGLASRTQLAGFFLEDLLAPKPKTLGTVTPMPGLRNDI